jgi:chemotaxis protein CheD
MGEMQLGCGEQSLKTLLGSCIGLALYSRRNAVGGLAHIVLPESRGQEGPPAKYVDTAIPELIRRIELAGGQATNLNAKIAGGANMLASQAVLTIGDQNLAAIRRMLREYGIPIVAEHCGGTQGRRMTFYPNFGRVTIEVVGGEIVEI